MDLNVTLLPWQRSVFDDPARYKIIAAGRRTGKSRLSDWTVLLEALKHPKCFTMIVCPTQAQARDLHWDNLLTIGKPVIAGSHINNMTITLVNGSKIVLKGADRYDTLRGYSLQYLVLDEIADIKPAVWEQALRPALADRRGGAMFIGTPKGRNHFWDLYQIGTSANGDGYKSWHFTSFDNPLIAPEEIEAARSTLSSFAFRQEFMASFEAAGTDVFKEEWVQYSDNEPDDGHFVVSVDLAGFSDVEKEAGNRKSRLDSHAISVVKIHEKGWWVKDIIYGRWGIKECAEKILDAAESSGALCVGIEKGALKNAVMPYMVDLMRRRGYYPRIEEMTHGNTKKIDRIVWALQGRFEHGRIKLRKAAWNTEFIDQLLQFPNSLVHDDLVDSLAYVDQIAVPDYRQFYDEGDEWEPLDEITGI